MKKIQDPLKGMIHDTQLSASDIVFNNIQLLNGTRIVCLHDLSQPCLGDLASFDSSNSWSCKVHGHPFMTVSKTELSSRPVQSAYLQTCSQSP